MTDRIMDRARKPRAQKVYVGISLSNQVTLDAIVDATSGEKASEKEKADYRASLLEVALEHGLRTIFEEAGQVPAAE